MRIDGLALIGKEKIIIIGGNAAGPAAAAKAKRVNPSAQVIMIESGEFISTGTCELPYVLSGEIETVNKIVFYSPETFHSEKGIEVLNNHFVQSIDRRGKTITVQNQISKHTFQLDYTKLILCTGSKSIQLSGLTPDIENVFYFKTVANLQSIQSYTSTHTVKRVLVVGAGYIGLEVVDAFVKKGIRVALIEKSEFPMPSAEPEIQAQLVELLKKNGVEFFGNIEDPLYIRQNNRISSVKINGWFIEFDMIIVAAGVTPNSDLAHSAKLDIGKTGGIIVDTKMKTNDSNIYAAGDCVESVNAITRQKEFIPLASLAHQQGHTAGENAAGRNNQFYNVIPNIAVQFLGINYITVGISSISANHNRINFGTVSASADNRIKVMNNSKPVFGKIIYDKNSNCILGASFSGAEDIIGYGDLIVAFIKNRIPANELANINYNYTPPLSPFVHLLSVLGRNLNKEIK